jgi:hypothetical protein
VEPPGVQATTAAIERILRQFERDRLMEAMMTCRKPQPANLPDQRHYPNHDKSLLHIRV